MNRISGRKKESTSKKQIKDWLDSEEIYWTEVAGGAFSKAGDPDLIICLNGKFVAIEGKTPWGALSNLQIRRKKQIEKSGGIYAVALDLQDVQELVSRSRSSID